MEASITIARCLSLIWRRFRWLSHWRGLDVVHEGLLCLVAADVHYLEEGVLVAEVHIRDAGASGCVVCHTFVAWHDDIDVEVGFWLKLVAAHRILLFHGQLGRDVHECSQSATLVLQR